jgi:hypothetical protein
MKMIKLMTPSLLIFCLLMSLSNTIQAADKADKPTGGPTDAQMAEMMKKWEEAATPGENHKLLDFMVGNWETVNRMWMAGPDQPAQETKGSEENKWVLGGRFIMMNQTGEMFGKPYEGMGLVGFDNPKNQFVMSWLDNSTTAITNAQGYYNPKDKTFTFFGLMDDPGTGEHGKTLMYIVRVINRDRYSFEMYDPEWGGLKNKIGEIVYTRKL